MKKKKYQVLPKVLVLLLICILLILSTKVGVSYPLSLILDKITTPVSASLKSSVSAGLNFTDPVLKKLSDENFSLQNKMANYNQLVMDNKALRDQFQTTQIQSLKLIPVQVIGAPSFIPGVTSINSLVIDKGSQDGIKVGQAVIYKNNLVGIISVVSPSHSSVNLVTNDKTVITAKTSKTNALGLIKGQGQEDMFLDNVILSDKLENGDLVLTKGDIGQNGIGNPPGFIIGKIIAVNKKESNIFQSADVKSLLDFERLQTIFVLKQ